MNFEKAVLVGGAYIYENRTAATYIKNRHIIGSSPPVREGL